MNVPDPNPTDPRPEFSPNHNVLSTTGGQGFLAARGTKVDVRLQCRDLVSLDGLAPNSFAVVYARTSGKTDWSEISRSETLGRNTAPEFRRIFQLEYRFELYQELRVVLFDRCTQSDQLQQQAFLGTANCTLGSIVSARGAELEVPLRREAQPTGTVLLRAEEIISARRHVTLEISLAQLMSEEQTQQQNTYLEGLKAQAAAPIEEPMLARRGAAAIMNKLRKEPRAPAVLPAHLENQRQEQVVERQQLQQQVEELQQAPPPFVPFLSILRAPAEAIAAPDYRSPEIQWEEVYKSTAIKDYKDLVQGVRLEPFKLSEYDLTEGIENRILKVCVVQAQSGQAGSIVGELITNFPSLRRMCTDAREPVLQLHPVGRLTVHKYEEEKQPSFMEYLRGGWCDFGLVCAIDFTSSNGDPRQPGSRHYNPAGGIGPPNEYEAAMRAVGNMLSSYSSDARIPAYGFGANLPPTWSVSHCFPVSEHEMGDPFCNGVDGLVRAYNATLSRVQLYGPTIFSEVLRTVGVIVSRRTEAAVRAGNNSLAYTVLLILTDGVISDFDATMAELIKLSALPLSIVIIGLGNEDFGKMHALDGSDGPLRRGTEFALREFVQFVPYNDFKGDLSVMAERVLGGIPDQVLSYITKVRGETAPTREV